MSSVENISVHVRVRPLNDTEKENAWGVDGNKNTIVQVDSVTGLPLGDAAPYHLDSVFDATCSTAHVYARTAKELIVQVLEGFNSTLFAYGQTSSGKTHTMRGTGEEPGIIPLAVRELFDLIAATQNREFLLRVSYMELYNEDINDLLAPENMKLPVHETRESGIHVQGLREDIVSSPEQVLQLLEEGERHRHVGETKMNRNSSRSHTIFRMVVESRSKTSADFLSPVQEEDAENGAIRVSTLTLVDLAGSERISKTGAEGQRAREGAAINKSLLTLGTVINKLSEGVAATGGHIPYRDSKLTRILQPSLGGNAKTAIICAVTPAIQHVEESHSTLRFACRAKRVVNNATVNEVLSDAAVLKRQAKEIKELRDALQSSGNDGGIDEEVTRLRAELLRRDQEKEHMAIALATEKEERERAQKKVESMARMMWSTKDGGSGVDGGLEEESTGMTNSGHQKSHNVHGLSKRSRRETWCPAGPSTQNVVHGESSGRRSGSDVMVTAGSSGSDAIKRQRRHLSADGGGHDGGNATDDDPHDAVALAERVKELEAANVQLQKELLVAVQEAQWKARQAEKELQTVAADRDAALLSVTRLESALAERDKDMGRDGAAVKEEIDRIRGELEAAQHASVELAETQAEVERLEEKLNKATKRAADAESKVTEMEGKVSSANQDKDSAEQRAGEAEARARALYEETQRLSAHIKDLESRKRAPLYQKKQEAELRAALDRASDAELRASEAEERAKEARNAVEAAERKVATLQKELATVKEAGEDAVADVKGRLQVAMQRAAAEAELAAKKYDEAMDAAKKREEGLKERAEAAEAGAEGARVEIERLAEELGVTKGALEETQACADAASQHVTYLEEKVDALEKEIEQLQGQLYSSQAPSAAGAAAGAEEKERERKHQRKAVGGGASGFTNSGATSKEEVARLNAALKSATNETKKVVEKASKDAERLRSQVKDLEQKLKTAIADKHKAQTDKTAVERELRSVSARVSSLDKAVSKATGIEERKREAIAAELAQVKGKLREVEDTLEVTRGELERCKTRLMEKEHVIQGLEDRVMHAELTTKRANEMAEIEGSKAAAAEKRAAQASQRAVEAEQRAGESDDRVIAAERQTADAERRAVVAEERAVTAEQRAVDAEQQTEEYEGRAEKAERRAVIAEERAATAEQRASTAEQRAVTAEQRAAESEERAVTAEQRAVDAEERAVTAEQRAVVAEERAVTAGQRAVDAEKRASTAEQRAVVAEERVVTAEQRAVDAEKRGMDAEERAVIAEQQVVESEERAVEADQRAVEAEQQAVKSEERAVTAEERAVTAEQRAVEADQRAANAEERAVTAEQRAVKSEERAVTVEQRAVEAEQQAANAEERALTAEQRAAEADQRAANAEERAVNAEQRAVVAEERAVTVEQRAVEAEQRAVKSEERALTAEERAAEADQRAANAEERAVIAEQRAVEAEQRGVAAEERAANAEQAKLTADNLVHSEMKSLIEKISMLEAKCSENKHQVELLESECGQLKHELQKAHDTAGSLQQELDGRDLSMSALKSQLNDMMAESLELKASLEETLAKCTHLENHMGQATAEWELARMELEAGKLAAESQVQYAQKESQQHIERIKELEEEVSSVRKAFYALQEQVGILQTKLHNESLQKSSCDACPTLKDELRKSKRREQKLQALQYRLQEDFKAAGGDVSDFARLLDARSLEYEIDKVTNRAAREKATLTEALEEARSRIQSLERRLTDNPSIKVDKSSKDNSSLARRALAERMFTNEVNNKENPQYL